MTLRPFEDLIKPIEIDGETFVPIEEIAKLVFNHNAGKVDNSNAESVEYSEIWVNSSYDFKAYIRYSVEFNPDVTVYFTVGIWRDFNVDSSMTINNHKDQHTPNNQVQIVKNLIKWGFVEP